MRLETWLSFLVAQCIIAVSPGSGAVLAMSHGLSYGLKKTSATIIGLQAGLLLLLFIAGAGIGSLLMASEIAFNLIKSVGALYLIYLGLSQWRARIEIDPAVADAGSCEHRHRAAPNFGKRFMTGFLTNATNPKGVIFMVAVLPQFISGKAALLPQLSILAVSVVVIDMIVMHGYAYAASSMQHYFRDARAVKKQNRFFGGLLMAVGAALFSVKRGTGA